MKKMLVIAVAALTLGLGAFVAKAIAGSNANECCAQGAACCSDGAACCK